MLPRFAEMANERFTVSCIALHLIPSLSEQRRLVANGGDNEVMPYVAMEERD